MGERESWMELLESTGAMQTGHFLLSSGRHSQRYIQCAKVVEDPSNASALGEALAGALAMDFDRVASPPLGGILIGYEVARHLGKPFFFPERAPDGLFQLRRGFTLGKGERVCIVEDVITTGRTTRELLSMLRGYGAEAVALAAIVDRSVDHEVEGLRVQSLLQLEIPTYTSEECPLCANGASLSRPGSRQGPEEPVR